MTLSELAARLGGQVHGDPQVEITTVGEIQTAGPGMIVLAVDARTLSAAEASGASALLIPDTLEPRRKPAIRTGNVRLAFARLLEHFAPPPARATGIHPTAVVGAEVALGPDVALGPNVVLGDRVRVGTRTAVRAGTVVGADAVIGADCLIYPQVTILERTVVGDRVIIHAGAVLGSDGFGYARDEHGPVKIPHLGRVVIEDDVEIGANTTIDRGTLGETRVGQFTKIDNLVQIAHNVRIGRGVLIVGQVGVAGSVTIGDGAVLAGHVGVPDHIHIGEGATLLARAVPTKDVAPHETVSGFPAQPHQEELRQQALLRRLPHLIDTVTALQRRTAELAARRKGELAARRRRSQKR